jgi:hypothetical protein
MANAVIVNSLVVNIIEGSAPGMQLVPDDGSAQIGGAWDGTSFHPAPPFVPEVISPRQFRQSLTYCGFRSNVESAVAASDQDTKDWYAVATQFERHHPKVVSMAQALGYTDAQVDQVWVYGSGI